ncbi:MAG: hypothetical protein MAG581_01376 [Deltaproteobacteria bacterium]|nr:hypothetical protein [Deltaproteobacteria bacterium]
MRSVYLLLIMAMLLAACSSVEPVMSKAGVMTHPDCAKFSTEEAVATCEAGLRQRGGDSRFTFGFGVSRQL